MKIVSESSVAAGVRRIEAYTGARVEEMLDAFQDTMRDLKALFNNAPDLSGAIRKYIEENAGLKLLPTCWMLHCARYWATT